MVGSVSMSMDGQPMDKMSESNEISQSVLNVITGVIIASEAGLPYWFNGSDFICRRLTVIPNNEPRA